MNNAHALPFDDLLGQRIIGLRPMRSSERRAFGWEHDRGQAVLLLLENGSKIVCSRDPEGNGPGALYHLTRDGTELIC